MQQKRLDEFRYQDMAALQSAARGQIKADLAIINCQLVNVLTYTIHPAEIFIHCGVIVHLTTDPKKFVGSQAWAQQIYDADGTYVAPGLLDSHVHCESSMLSPYYFGREVLRHGTTSCFTDPHEIANVAGLDGLRFMLENSQNVPVRQFILIPSCVPSVVDLENSGANFTAATIKDIASWQDPRIIGLAEVMDYLNVIKGEPRMSQILDAATDAGLYLQSHYHQLFDRDLSAYLIRGLGGNHELRSVSEVVETLRQGGWVDLKGASSISDPLPQLLRALLEFPNPEVLRLTLCTDDVHAKDITHRGHINYVVNRLINAGFSPIFALACATRNTAQEYRISNLGSIAVGNLADLIIFPNLYQIQPTAVFIAGTLLVDREELLLPAHPYLSWPSKTLSPALTHSVKLDPIMPADLMIKLPFSSLTSRQLDVNVINFATKVTELEVESIKIINGQLDLTNRPDLAFAAVFNRYGQEKKTLAVIKNFGLADGAVASTVSHDCHNLTAVWRDPLAAMTLINEIIRRGGGLGGQLDNQQQIINLPIGGLMSQADTETVIAEQAALQKLYQIIFRQADVSLMKPVSLALIVSPKFKISDEGIIDVIKQQRVPLFPR